MLANPSEQSSDFSYNVNVLGHILYGLKHYMTAASISSDSLS